MPVSKFEFTLQDEAKNKESMEPILCECKAHEKEVDTGDLLKFFGNGDVFT
jgi:hypothetical protein